MRFLFLFSLFFGVGFAESFSVSTTAELRQALKIASENNASNTILLQEATYSIIDDGIGTFEYSSENNLSLIGIGKVILSGHDLTRIFQIYSNQTVVFSNLTLTKGNEGAILSTGSGTIQILDSNITLNSSSSYRGAISGYSNIEVVNSTFTLNNGGAIDGDSDSNIEVVNSTFTLNNGGAISGDSDSNIEVVNSTFSYNNGGAISGDSDSNIEVVNSTFSENSSNYGGAISGSNIEVVNSTFSENSSSYYGGAINGSNIEVVNSTFSENSVSSYGGGAINGLNIEVVNSTFSENSAFYGGAISGSNIEVVNSTFSENSASDGGGAIYGYSYYGSNIEVVNSIFSENSSDYYGNDIYIYSGTLLIYNNYIQESNIYENENEYGDVNATIQNNFSTGLVWKDGKLSIPDGNSSTIDAGMNLDSGVATYLFGQDFIDKISPLLQTDKYCNNRVENGTIDIGAFEFGGVETDSCDLNRTDYLDENITDINYSNNITIDNNLSCESGWSFDESRSVCVKDDEANYDEASDFETVSIDFGWSLRAVDLNVSEIPDSVSIVWTYSDGNWSAFSPNGEFTQKIYDSAFQTISKPLSSENGTWFKSDKDFYLTVSKEISDDISTPTPPSLVAKNIGWNLLGTARELPAEVISCENGDVRLMWRFFEGEWLLYSPEVNPSLYDLMFNTILANDGFWVLCE